MKMYKYLKSLVIMIILFSNLSHYAQGIAPINISLRNFDSVQIYTYSKDKAFIYPKHKKSFDLIAWIDSLILKFWRWVFGRTYEKIVLASYSKWILVGSLAVIMICIIYFFLRSRGLFRKSSGESVLNLENDFYTGKKISYDHLISDAIAQQNLRLAVRLYYLKLLQLLDEKELIHWTKDKTNHDYSRELRSTNYFKDFIGVTHLFDWIWYGEVEISPDYFEFVKSQFLALESKLNSKNE